MHARHTPTPHPHPYATPIDAQDPRRTRTLADFFDKLVRAWVWGLEFGGQMRVCLPHAYLYNVKRGLTPPSTCLQVIILFTIDAIGSIPEFFYVFDTQAYPLRYFEVHRRALWCLTIIVVTRT